ncbi:MAG: hypothetical protein NT159_16960 [Proteobacteria bacterium]|nr:hypothetical protein [Pseudomonadota bacterium]
MKHLRQHGFSIVTAIFILVVLAALGAFIVTVSTNQAVGSALDVQGSRAYQAARSGIEWGVYQVQSTAAYRFGYTAAGVATYPNSRSCSTASGSFVPAAPTLSGFTVTVSCTSQADLLSGTITTSTASASVTGVSTLFLSELGNGQSFCDATGLTIIGTILSRASDTALTLTGNAAITGAGVQYTRCGPTVYTIASIACNQPSGGSCPNTTNPNSFYVERRLDVVF